MIKVTSILVRSYDLDHLDVFWMLNEQLEERIEEYDFYILRSVDGAAGPYKVISGPLYNTFLFRDSNVQRLSKWREYYYKIRAVHRASNREEEFGPEWVQAPPDRLAIEIRRREDKLFREFGGREVFLFPRLTFGQRCRHCWDTGSRDNTIGRSTQQNCGSCFDVSFVGGFAAPMIVFMQIDPSPKQPQRTDLKEHQFVRTTARCTYFPPIRPKDMIVEAENKRWLVEKVSFTEKHRAVIRQELELTQYGKDDIKHTVPIRADAQRLHMSEKALKRPMCLDFPEDDSVGDLVGPMVTE